LSVFSGGGLWTWLKDYCRSALRPRAPFLAPDKRSLAPIPNEASFAIIGDWGTGTEEAARIAALVEKHKPDYTIHLGDVYYVGNKEFILANCCGIRQRNGYDPVKWPRGRRGSFAMNGNHEAYARDGAYFWWISTYLDQPSSCFFLYNDHWCVLGLDTGYHSEGIPLISWLAERLGWKWLMPSCKLPRPALIWLEETVRPYLTRERGLILLTHHQPCSAFDNEYPDCARQLSNIEGIAGRQVLWFWGHEHRLAAYDFMAAEQIRAYGRCLGHGGMPVERGAPVKTGRENRRLLFYDDRSYDAEHGDVVNDDAPERQTHFGVNGYATLTLRGTQAKMIYVDVSGAEIAAESWTVQQGKVIQGQSVAFGRAVRLQGARMVAAPSAHAQENEW
jgi:hypothetical protein